MELDKIETNALFKITNIYAEKFLLEHGAVRSIIHFRKNGTLLINEPYLEVEIYWLDEGFATNNTLDLIRIAEDCSDLILNVKDLGGHMVVPIWELKKGKLPVLVWAVFFTKETETTL